MVAEPITRRPPGPQRRRVAVQCRKCSETRYLQPARLKLFQPSAELETRADGSAAWLCNRCRPRPSKNRRVQCRQCRAVVSRPPSKLRTLASLKDEAGRLTYLCRRCKGRAQVGFARAELLRIRGISSTDSDEVKKAELQRHIREASKKAGGDEHVFRLRDEGRQRGHTAGGKRRQSIRQLASAERRGQFRPCDGCHKLVYRQPYQLTGDRLVLHRPCTNQYLASDAYRGWLQTVGDPRSPMFAIRRGRTNRPRPARPRGRLPQPEQLGRYFRWLIRHYLDGESWRTIGRKENYHHTTVKEGVQVLIDLLPDTWSEVYGGRHTGKRLDVLLPVWWLRDPVNMERTQEVDFPLHPVTENPYTHGGDFPTPPA